MRRRVRWALAPAVIGLIGVAGAACSTGTSGSASTAATASATSSSTSAASSSAAAPAVDGECAEPGAPVVDLPTYASTDPIVGIPVPAGWERDSSLDSELIRGAFVSKGLAKDDFAPNVTIVAADVTSAVSSAQEGVQAQVDSIESIGGQILSQEDLTVCGHPAALAQVRLPAMGAVPERDGSMLVIVSESGETLMATVLTLQTLDSADPAYRADAATIVEGVQIATPGGRD